METYVMLVLVIIIGLILLLVVGRAFFGRRRRPVSPRPDYYPITAERIERAFVQLQRTLEQQPLTRSVLAHHGYPDAQQWLVLLQQTPQEAADLLNALRMQFAQRGAYADFITIDSIIAYEAAQKYLQAYSPIHPIQGEQPPAAAPTDETYPNEQEWRRRLSEDRKEALRLRYELELQRARFGLFASPTLEASIAAFQRAAHDESVDNDNPEPRA